MRVFLASLVAVALLAGGAYLGLSHFQESSADAYTTGSARLDWQEQVDAYGREQNPD